MPQDRCRIWRRPARWVRRRGLPSFAPENPEKARPAEPPGSGARVSSGSRGGRQPGNRPHFPGRFREKGIQRGKSCGNQGQSRPPLDAEHGDPPPHPLWRQNGQQKSRQHKCRDGVGKRKRPVQGGPGDKVRPGVQPADFHFRPLQKSANLKRGVNHFRSERARCPKPASRYRVSDGSLFFPGARWPAGISARHRMRVKGILSRGQELFNRDRAVLFIIGKIDARGAPEGVEPGTQHTASGCRRGVIHILAKASRISAR